jgi:FixJ family two-component response regulator
VVPQSRKERSHRTQDAGSAEAFLNSDRLHDIDCVISDVQMPGMNGKELQSKLIVHGHHLPMIFVTALSEMRARAQALAVGAIGFFLPNHSAMRN